VCRRIGAWHYKRSLLLVEVGIIQATGVTPTAEAIRIRATDVVLNVERGVTASQAELPRAGRRDRPPFVTLPSKRLDDPPWNAFNAWLRLNIGDGPPYQLNGHSHEFCNAAWEGIDRAEADRLGLWLVSYVVDLFTASGETTYSEW
jgi:hypothetical protein